MAQNGISTLSTKEARQHAKLALAETNRQAGGDTGAVAYRARNYYDITQLPTQYTGVWHHFALVRDSSNHLALYLNGVRTGYDAAHTVNYNAVTDYLFNSVGGVNNISDSKLADFEISNTNLYDPTQSTINIPSIRRTVNSSTRLLMDGSVSKTTDAAGIQTLTQFNGSISLDSEFPDTRQTLVVTHRPENDGANAIYTITAGADLIPVGANLILNDVYRRVQSVTANSIGAGITQIVVNPQPNAGGQGFVGGATYTVTWYT
jgi:hypothetical protein